METNLFKSGQVSKPATGRFSDLLNIGRNQAAQAVAYDQPRARDPLAHSTARPRPQRATRPILSFNHIDLRVARDQAKAQLLASAEVIPVAPAKTAVAPVHEIPSPIPASPRSHAVPDLHIEPRTVAQFHRAERNEGQLLSKVQTQLSQDSLSHAPIEPKEPIAKPDFPTRLRPSQRARVERPVTLRTREGQLAYVTYTFERRG
jgi:hypothetical protein